MNHFSTRERSQIKPNHNDITNSTQWSQEIGFNTTICQSASEWNENYNKTHVGNSKNHQQSIPFPPSNGLISQHTSYNSNRESTMKGESSLSTQSTTFRNADNFSSSSLKTSVHSYPNILDFNEHEANDNDNQDLEEDSDEEVVYSRNTAKAGFSNFEKSIAKRPSSVKQVTLKKVSIKCVREFQHGIFILIIEKLVLFVL